MTVLPADGSPRLMQAAAACVRPREKYCCALMERIERQEGGVFVLAHGADGGAAAGVLAYTDGQLALCCLPQDGPDVRAALADFFSTREVFCLSGTAEYARLLADVLRQLGRRLRNERRLLFMEHAARSRADAVASRRCTARDEDALLPLHLAYLQEEVLPAGRRADRAAERLALVRLLRRQIVLAVPQDGGLVAKAQTSARSSGCMQIGGVYTAAPYRGRGLAASLCAQLAAIASGRRQSCVLFVSPQNRAAVHAYRTAGFVRRGRYIICYYE